MRKLSHLVFKLIFIFTIPFIVGCSKNHDLPEDFVFLKDIDPTIIENVRYHTNANFTGRPIIGYETNRIVCTNEAAQKLKNAHDDFKSMGYMLVIYDGYRPQRAVEDFIRWGKDNNDQLAKELYYPTVDKSKLFELKYIAKKSSHSRGSAFDLTIIKIDNTLKPIDVTKRKIENDELPFLDDNTVDMGSSFDLFHEISHHDSSLVSSEHVQKRNLLRDTLRKHGFKEYKEKWWHYTLENEPYPDTYFDFVVTK